ncbi:MAG: hypothetical protein HYS62_02240 [Candidatus Aenigmarchaeota archaeon]|nr:hypothetical protein [Candidatus Aenigmarchaeota archaeon]
MPIETQITTCSEHYQMWKDKALLTSDIYESKKALERAFFWMELRSAFIFLRAVEQTRTDSETKEKLIKAKLNLSKKLSEYLKERIKEI